MALEADAIRFVLLDCLSGTASVLALWRDALENDPLGFQASQQPGNPSFASGKIGLLQCTMILHLNRLELLLQKERQVGSGAPGAIQDISTALSEGKTAVKKLLSRYEIGRVAVVLDLSQEVEDEASAALCFGNAVSLGIDLQGARDLSFQISRRVPSRRVGGVEINRLSRWATGVKQLIQMQMGPGATNLQAPKVLNQQSVFNIMHDVNTTTRDVALTVDERQLLLDEVVEEAEGLVQI